jgi:hypothetical protein
MSLTVRTAAADEAVVDLGGATRRRPWQCPASASRVAVAAG